MEKKDAIKAAQVGLQNILPFYGTVLAPFFASHPYWLLTFYVATGLYGVYMAYNQEEINEIVEFIKDHPHEFREEIVQSKEFEKSFLQYMELYLKERIERKKGILGNILLGYTTSSDKENYDLERLNDALVRMTLPTLTFLLFLKNEIVPSLEEVVEGELRQDRYKKSDRSLEWWKDQMMTQRSVWEIIDRWYNGHFEPSQKIVKEEYGVKEGDDWPPDLQHRAETRNRDMRNKAYAAISELVSLGIIDFALSPPTFGGATAKDYRLSTFGLKFIRFI